ncbi:MAG: VanZ family protein [Oscillospiraceae bacterium]|jgi:glycopeptide antibiotics resistance protein|nr:VanZ family protein [Oscillospiraceae bacterium]
MKQAESKRDKWIIAGESLLFAGFFICSSFLLFAYIGNFALQLACSVAAGVVFGFLGVFLPCALWAIANGVGVYLGFMVGFAVSAQIHEQVVADWPGGWIYLFFYDTPMVIMSTAFASYCTVLIASRFAKTEERRALYQFSLQQMGWSNLFFYLCLLVYVFLLVRYAPGTDVRLVFREGLHTASVNLIPGHSLAAYISHFRQWGSVAYEDYFYLLGNVFFFAPMGFFLRSLLKRKPLPAFLYCIGFSLLMELCQLFFNLGDCDIDDLLLNALGSLIGIAAAVGTERFTQKPTPETPEIA